MRITSVVLLLLGIAFVAAQEDPIKWAGSTKGFFQKIYIPSYASDGSCVASTSGTYTPYTSFTQSFPTAGVREVAAMAEGAFRSYIQIYIYNGTFSSSKTCSNLFFIANQKQFSSTGGPSIDEFVYFEANKQYTFVISGTSGTSGLFAVNIFSSISVGQLSTSGPVWQPLSSYYGKYSCSISSSTPTPYGTFTWTQQTTGYYDIYGLFDNPNLQSYYSYIALYNGTVNTTALATDPCNAGSLMLADYKQAFGAFFPYVSLTAGVEYTLILSSYAGAVGYWGVQVIPTRVRFYHNSGFNQPSRSSGLTCDTNGYTDCAWDSTTFTAEYKTYLVDTGTLPSSLGFDSLDTYSFLYSGNNTGTDANPPHTCPTPLSLLSYGDTGDRTPVYTTTSVGSLYTVVVSTYSSGAHADPSESYSLYLFTGRPVTDQTNAAPQVVVTPIGLLVLAAVMCLLL